MNAIEYLKTLTYLLHSEEGNELGRPSNSELYRWLMKGSVIINGKKPKPKDEIEFPIYELVFFPKGHTITIVKEG